MNSPLAFFLFLAFWFCGLTIAIRVPVSYDDTPSSCPGPAPKKVVLCYYEGHLALQKLDPCLCSHLVFTEAATINSNNYTLNLTTDVGKTVRELRKRNPELHALVSVGGVRVSTEVAEALVKSADRRAVFASSVGRIVRDAELNGIEINFKLDAKGGSKHSKGGLVALAKLVRKEMGADRSHRNKRDYSVFEQLDDISTTAWTPPRRYALRDVRKEEVSPATVHRPILRSARTDTDSYARELLRQSYLALEIRAPKDKLLLVSVPIQPEVLVKRFDLKTLSKYVDYFTLPTHNLTDSSENGFSYHPSRLMGLADILNTDSLLDLVSGLGAPHDKLIITIPATATQFTLKDAEKNTPRSPVTSKPETLSQTRLCALMAAGGWTIERDEDLTAPYAFKNDSWLAFDDRISVGIKSKYVLLRDLAGAALYPIDSADWSGSCFEENSTHSKAPHLLNTLHHAFTSLARKSRGAVLETLQEDIRTSTLLTFSGDVHLSPYRIVRVVDNLGAVHVVRKDARTEFECSRQGYFRHPLGCNRFYRCVKFNQYSSDFTVFEYDCPAGLAFDERWEVCVWPGSLPEGACHGSSEIAPVPRARYACPGAEGYYADPENCRWFFACLDHTRDGVSPLTAYEFRCPFGLVFDEKNLLCQWPWLVDGCGNIGVFAGAYFGAVEFGSAAKKGYVLTAGEGHVTTGGIADGALGAGVRVSQGSGATGTIISGSGLGVHSGVGIGEGASFSSGYEAGHGAGGVVLTDANAANNVFTSSGYVAGAGRGSIKYNTAAVADAGFGGQIANSYIAGGRSSQRFGNVGSYNEGRHISSYASLPDSYVSGGRIDNSGGVVLGQNVALHGIGKEFGVRTGDALVIPAGQTAGIASGNAAFVNTGNAAAGRSSYAANVVHGSEGGYFSGGVVSSVPVQAAVPVTAYQQTVVDTPKVQTVPVTVHGNEGGYFSGGVVSSVPVQAAVPVTTYQQTVVETPKVQTVPVTVHGNKGGYFSGGVVSSVPVQAGIPVTAYQQTVVETPKVQTVPVTTGTFRRKPVLAQVPAVQPAAVPIAQTVPLTTYQQTVAETPHVPVVSEIAYKQPAVAKVPVVQSAPVPVVHSVPVPEVQSVPVPAVQAVPVTSYQQTVVGTPQVSFRKPVIPKAPLLQAAPTPIVQSLPIVQSTPVPIVQSAPIITHHQSVVQTPQVPVPVPIVSVNTYRRPATSKISVIQPASVPIEPVAPVFQQAIPITTSIRKPIAPQVSVVETAPVTTYIERAPAAPSFSTRTRLRPIKYQEPAIPVVQSVPIAQPIVPVAQPTLPVVQPSVVPVAQSAVHTVQPLAPVSQPAIPIKQVVPIVQPTVSVVQPAVSLAQPAVHSFQPAVSVVNTYQSTPAPTVVPVQSGANFVVRGRSREGYSFQRKPVVSVFTGGAAGISVPVAKSNVEVVTPVYTENTVPVTPVPHVKAGFSAGYSYSTPANPVVTSGPISVSSVPVVKTSYSSGNFISSTPAPAIITGSAIPVAPVIKSTISTGGYSYSTPATAIFTGSPVSITPVPVVKSRVSSGRYSISTPAPAVLTGESVPVVQSNFQSVGYSYPSPAPAVVTSSPIPLYPEPRVQTLATGIVTGDAIPITKTKISTVDRYSYSKPSVPFVTGKVATFRGVSLASGLEPAVFDSTPGLVAGLEIPSSTVAPALIDSSITSRPYSRIGATRLRVVPPTENIQIGNIQGGGFISSNIAPAVAVTTAVPISQGYQKTIIAPTISPIDSVPIDNGDFGTRTYYQSTGSEFVAPYSGAVVKEGFIPQSNLSFGNYFPPATVGLYTTGTPIVAPLNVNIGRSRGRGRIYSGQFSGHVSSTPIPEISTPSVVYSTSRPSVLYSSTQRPTTFQVPRIVTSTPRPVTYTSDIGAAPKFVVSTQTPVVAKAYLPAVPSVATVTSVPLVKSTLPVRYESVDRFGSRIGGTAPGRKAVSRTRVNYDNGNVEALLDKYSGKFGGILDNNKEEFITKVITDDVDGRGQGRLSQIGRGGASQRGRFDSSGSAATPATQGGYLTANGYSERYSTTPAVNIRTGTLGSTGYSRARGGYSSTTETQNILTSTVGGGLRGKVRFGSDVNIDADGGIGYDAVTVGYEGAKSRSKEGPVVVITRLSDVNPLLIAKLGAQCTCKSNTVTLKRPDGYSRGRPRVKSDPILGLDLNDDISLRSGTYGTPEHIPSAPLPGSNIVTGSSPDDILGLGDVISSTSPPLDSVSFATPRTDAFLKAVGVDNIGVTPAPTVLITTFRSRARPINAGVTYTTGQPLLDISSPSNLVTNVRSRVRPQVVSTPAVPLIEVSSPTPVRLRARPQVPVVVSTTAVPVIVTGGPDLGRAGYPGIGSPSSGVVGRRVGSAVGTDRGVDLDGVARAGKGAGRSFDRYGPGGWRGLDETLQGSVDCQRPGLFRHPKYCNKFYACHWDEWKGRYTLHVFNCPVHLAYDSSLGACNWPSKGPACADDNLLV